MKRGEPYPDPADLRGTNHSEMRQNKPGYDDGEFTEASLASRPGVKRPNQYRGCNSSSKSTGGLNNSWSFGRVVLAVVPATTQYPVAIPRGSSRYRTFTVFLPPTVTDKDMAEALGSHQTEYRCLETLGSCRSSNRSDSSRAGWNNESFRAYADYALSDESQNAFDKFIELGANHIPVIMCAEAVYWWWHRRIVAD